MRRKNYPFFIEIAIVTYCTIQSFDLAEAWMGGGGVDPLGWLAFILWISPVAYFWGSPLQQQDDSRTRHWLMGLALTFSPHGNPRQP